MPQFVLLPLRGLHAQGRTANAGMRNFMVEASAHFAAAAGPQAKSAVVAPQSAPNVKMRVLDAVAEDGAKLVDMTPDEALNLRQQQPGMKLVPVVYYYPQVKRRKIETVAAAASSTAIRLTIQSKKDNAPVAGAKVVAFTDFANRVGVDGTTNSKGIVDLKFGSLSKKLERLYVYPARSVWNLFQKNVTIKSGDVFKLQPVDLSFEDALRHFYAAAPDGTGANVKVGIIDSGIDLHHKDLTVSGGENTVQGESPNDFGDNGGEGHGTHVAGIIAAHGTPPTGVRGLAPGAELYSFRVFAKEIPGKESGASNFAIAKAIDRAVKNGCDIINMSLGGGPVDDATRAAMEDAVAAGAIVIVASGNDDRSPVSFPASASPPAIAVSAFGRKGTYPKGTTGDDAEAKPFGKDTKNYIASFSNVGPQIDLTCTGVGIISTVPGGYVPMDGTSMATPAVSGFAARLLSGMPGILAMPRDSARSDAIAKAVLGAARKLGFGASFEGHGFPS